MQSRSLRSTRLVVTGLVTSLALVTFACSGADPSDAAAEIDAGADATTADPTPSEPSPDSAAPVDAGEITADGDLPDLDLDGGAGDGDGGVDAGASCAALTSGAYVDSTCYSSKTLYAGGALTSTTYDLTSVQALGSVTYCATTFKVVEHKGVLVATAASPTTARFQFLEQYTEKTNIPIKRVAMVRHDVDVTAVGNALTFTPAASCPGAKAPPAGASYSVATLKGGKKQLTLVLPYGAKGSAIYRFTER
jgi:hypothetical protein